MARTQKNKATSFHLGQLKAKLAKLKRELLTPTSGGGGGGGAGFDVARTGVASVGFIGFPSVGKSTLMSKLTGQHSEAAAYEFTTLTSVPGQVTYNGECVSFCSRRCIACAAAYISRVLVVRTKKSWREEGWCQLRFNLSPSTESGAVVLARDEVLACLPQRLGSQLSCGRLRSLGRDAASQRHFWGLGAARPW